MTKCVSPWYKRPGWLDVKQQFTYRSCWHAQVRAIVPCLLDSLFLQLPALHNFLHVYWTASSCSYLHYTVFSVLIGQPPPALTCITQFSPCLLDSLLLLLPALHSFLCAYWTASSCSYLHYTVFSIFIGQPPPAVSCITQFSLQGGDSNYGRWRACNDINQGDKGPDIPSQLWCLFTSPKSCSA